MSSYTRYTSNAGSTRLVFKAGGELVALTFPVPKSGYKSPGAYGSTSVFSGESTNGHFQKQVLAAGEGRAKKLEPYWPLAPRNRPKHLLENVVGTRDKLHPCIQHEKYRGSSKVKLTDGNIESKTCKNWKTMNQVFAECSQAREVMGIGNQGISSDVARFFHKKQGIHGTR